MQSINKIERLNAAMKAGTSLNIEELAWHCGVHPRNAPSVAKKLSLHPGVGSRYPWRRIWRCIHRTEGARLNGHLDTLRDVYPDSAILAGIKDLEAALRDPLIDFAAMAARLGEKPDTLAKAMRQHRIALPFPTIDLGARKRQYRPLEVRLWVEEEISLDLPKPPKWATISAPPAETAQLDEGSPSHFDEATSTDQAEICAVDDVKSLDPVKKAVFDHFGANSRNPLT